VAARRSITVRIRGQEFRIRSDADEESLQRIASFLDDAMVQVEERTGTVDSFDLAMLTALNLARELVELRDVRGDAAGADVSPDRMRSLIELAEQALSA
jgi:cell division protein ZapA (FtsZ GTPase activity inhibitor)